MYGVVRADQKICAALSKLVGGGKHELADCAPVAAVDALHILGERVCVHRDFGMSVRSQKLRPFNADRAITERRTFGRAGDNANVLRHAGWQTVVCLS